MCPSSLIAESLKPSPMYLLDYEAGAFRYVTVGGVPAAVSEPRCADFSFELPLFVTKGDGRWFVVPRGSEMGRELLKD